MSQKIQDLENLLETIFLVSFTIIENILSLAKLLEMLLNNTIIECKKNRQLHKKYCFS